MYPSGAGREDRSTRRRLGKTSVLREPSWPQSILGQQVGELRERKDFDTVCSSQFRSFGIDDNASAQTLEVDQNPQSLAPGFCERGAGLDLDRDEFFPPSEQEIDLGSRRDRSCENVRLEMAIAIWRSFSPSLDSTMKFAI